MKRKDTDYRRRGLVNSGKKVAKKKSPSSVLGNKVSTFQAYYDIMGKLSRESKSDMLYALKELSDECMSKDFTFDYAVTANNQLYMLEPSLRSLFMYNDLVTFRQILTQIVNDVAFSYINSIKSNYRLVADAALLCNRIELMGNVSFYDGDESDKSRRARFAYVFKVVYDSFMGPKGYDQNMASVAISALNTMCRKPSRFLMEILRGRRDINVDHRLLFDLVVRSC